MVMAGAADIDDADRPERSVAVSGSVADREEFRQRGDAARGEYTPLYEMPKCGAIAGIDWLLAKHQGMNPTGSFKDTGMTAAISVAAERGF